MNNTYPFILIVIVLRPISANCSVTDIPSNDTSDTLLRKDKADETISFLIIAK